MPLWRGALSRSYKYWRSNAVIPSEWLYSFIKRKETCSLRAYPDGNGYSIGYGHHAASIKRGDVITQAQADEWLHQDVATAATAVAHGVTSKLTQPQYDALVSFVYNVGQGAFRVSSVRHLLNSGDYVGAANAMLLYTSADGRENPALVMRRHEEADRFLNEA